MELSVLHEEKNEDTIYKCYTHIYSHLMKFLKVKNYRSSKWVATVYNHIELLQKVKDSYWKEFYKNPDRYSTIMEAAIEEFIEDNKGNQYANRYIAEDAFMIVIERINFEDAK